MATVTPLNLTDETFTGRATGAAIVGGRFVKVAATQVIDRPNGDPLPIVHATAAADGVVGVALYDADDGHTTTFATIGSVVPVAASDAITAGAFVTVTTAGKAVTVAGRSTAVGIAWQTAANADDMILVQLV